MGTLFLGGEILTLNAEDELAEALVVEGGEIRFVGGLSDAVSLCDLHTEVIDLGGRALVSCGAYRLLSAVGEMTDDWREVPRLLRELGAPVLEWGADAELAVLSGRLIGCPPQELASVLVALPTPTEKKELRSLL